MHLKESARRIGRRVAVMSGLVHQPNEVAASLRSIEHRANHVDRGTQLMLAFKYRELAHAGIRCPFDDIEFRNYSQNGEDGIL